MTEPLWSTAKSRAHLDGVKAVAPDQVCLGEYGRPVSAHHVVSFAALKMWPEEDPCYCEQLSKPVNGAKYRVIDGNHRVKAAKKYNWPLVHLLIVGTDLPVPKKIEYALASQAEATAFAKSRPLNAVDCIIAYTRFAEDASCPDQPGEMPLCPTMAKMVASGVLRKMNKKNMAPTISSVQSDHRMARQLWRRPECLKRMRWFSASLSDEESLRLVKGKVAEWEWSIAPFKPGLQIPESIVMVDLGRFFDTFTSKYCPSRAKNARRALSGSPGSPKRPRVDQHSPDELSPLARLPSDGNSPRPRPRESTKTALVTDNISESVEESGKATSQSSLETNGLPTARKWSSENEKDHSVAATNLCWACPSGSSNLRLSSSEAMTTLQSLIQAAEVPESDIDAANREASLIGVRIESSEEESRPRLYASRSLRSGHRIPVHGKVHRGQGTGRTALDVQLIALSGTMRKPVYLRVSRTSCASYARGRQNGFNAKFVELQRSRDRQLLMDSRDSFVTHILSGNYCFLELSEDVPLDREIIVEIEEAVP